MSSRSLRRRGLVRGRDVGRRLIGGVRRRDGLRLRRWCGKLLDQVGDRRTTRAVAGEDQRRQHERDRRRGRELRQEVPGAARSEERLAAAAEYGAHVGAFPRLEEDDDDEEEDVEDDDEEEEEEEEEEDDLNDEDYKI